MKLQRPSANNFPVTELQAEPRGRLKIAAPFTTFYHLFPGKLKKYLELFPQVELTLLDFRVIMESSNVELSALYVEMGLGVSFATVAKELPVLTERRLEFIDLVNYFPPDHIAVIMRKDQVVSPYKKALLNVLFD